jgi:hypothetical protein
MEIYRDETGRYYAFDPQTCQFCALESTGYTDAQEEADSLYGTKVFVELVDDRQE